MNREEALELLEAFKLAAIDESVIDRQKKMVAEAFDMAIEALKAQEWIPCSEKMPDEKEWIGTKRFGTTISDTVYVTFENPNGERFARHLRFQNGKLSSSDQQLIGVFFKGSKPIAWKPMPDPWKRESTGE